jgi:hypothetical protein
MPEMKARPPAENRRNATRMNDVVEDHVSTKLQLLGGDGILISP